MTTFSQEVKKAACAVKCSGNEKAGELLGLICSCDIYDERGILFVTESEDAMSRFCRLLSRLCGIDAESSVRRGSRGKRLIFEGGADVYNAVSKIIPQPKDADFSVLSKDNVGISFIRGLFLGAGSVSAPSKSIYAEIGIKNEEIIEPTLDIFSSLDIVVRVSHRATGNFFYFKTVDDVSQLLFEIDAKNPV